MRFFDYARERYQILLNRRAGQPPPWTDDPILQKYRFCNVFRQDDTVTIWIKDNLLTPLTASVLEWNLLPVMCAARLINRVETLDALKDILLEEGWHSVACKAKLRDLRKAGRPLVTGAYMIRTPHGMDKIDGLDAILRPIQRAAKERGFEPTKTLQAQHAAIKQFPFMGDFYAYEVVTDLSYAIEYFDHYSWASAGPGAVRGLGRVFHGAPKFWVRSERQQPRYNALMEQLLKESHRQWPTDWPCWDMRTVEHTLCEFDKYERVRLGEGEPKQLYKHEPAHCS